MLTTTNEHFEQLESLLTHAHNTLEKLDEQISTSSEKLDGDDAELEKCLTVC